VFSQSHTKGSGFCARLSGVVLVQALTKSAQRQRVRQQHIRHESNGDCVQMLSGPLRTGIENKGNINSKQNRYDELDSRIEQANSDESESVGSQPGTCLRLRSETLTERRDTAVKSAVQAGAGRSWAADLSNGD